MDHFAIHQKLAKHCKSTIFQKKIFFKSSEVATYFNSPLLPFPDCDDTQRRTCYQRDWLAFLVYFFIFWRNKSLWFLHDSSILPQRTRIKIRTPWLHWKWLLWARYFHTLCHAIVLEPSEVAIIILFVF